MKRILAVALSVAILGQGCATILHQTTRTLSISSTPPGAQATIDGTSVTTPSLVHVNGKSHYILTVKKDGYRLEQRVIDSRVYVGSVIVDGVWILGYLAGILFLGIDFLDGAVYYPETPAIDVALAPEK